MALWLALLSSAKAADLEITETLPLPEAHSVNWVRTLLKDHPEITGDDWERLRDPAKTVVNEAAPRSWVWNIPDALWRSAVQQKGEGKREDVRFQLWIPEGVGCVKGIVVISGAGVTNFL